MFNIKLMNYLKRISGYLTFLSPRRRWAVYTLSFFIPLIVFVIISAALSIYPFGKNTFLISDMSNQYVSFLSYFRTLFGGTNDIFYTFSKNLGGDMTGLFSYYLFSPFNLITLLFSTDNLSFAVTAIIILKISACGLTFNYLISKCFGGGLRTIIFSTAYALIGYNIVYCFNIMWLDGVILLPLIILGIHKIFDNKTPLLYLFSLFAALVTNYYIGFMLCIFSAVYFIYRSVQVNKHSQLLKKIAAYASSSLVAVGLAAALLIPVFLSLRGGKASFSPELLTFTENFSFTDVFSKLFTNSFNWDQEVNGLPNIFCGIPVVILSIQYFFNKKVRLKEKVCSAGLVCVMLASFHINMLNLFWHGLNVPSWFPYRYSFVFSFILIILAYKNFQNIAEGISIRRIIYSGLVFLVGAIVIDNKNLEFLSIKYIYFDLFLAVCTCALLYAYIANSAVKNIGYDKGVHTFCRNKNLIIITALLAFFQIGDLSVNAYNSIHQLNDVFCEGYAYYSDYAKDTGSVIDSVKSKDTGVYRLEKTFNQSKNDPMLFDYKGLSHFSSTEKGFVKSFLGKLGFSNTGDWAYYNTGSTTAVDSLLGLKYLLTESATDKPYDILSTGDKISVYRNPYALPLAFTASWNAANADISTEYNMFETQNKIFKSLVVNSASDIFTPAQVTDVSLVNTSEEKLDDSTQYKRIDKTQESYVVYNIKATSTDELYGYLYAPSVQGAEIYVNDESLGKYFDTYRWDIFPLGHFQQDDNVTLKIKLLDDTIKIQGADFYYENIGALKDDYQQLSGGFCNLNEISSSHLKGTVNVPEGNRYLVLSIPYEDSWNIYVDGKQSKKSMVFGALMAVYVSPGYHTVELQYIPDGLYLGTAVSSISLLIILGYIAFLVVHIIKHKQVRETSVGKTTVM